MYLCLIAIEKYTTTVFHNHFFYVVMYSRPLLNSHPPNTAQMATRDIATRPKTHSPTLPYYDAVNAVALPRTSHICSRPTSLSPAVA